MSGRAFTFRPNPDALHCFQCTFAMTVELLTGRSLRDDEVDDLTGFRDGLETWPFAGMLALADMGLWVRNTENFDPNKFVEDPRAELLRQTNGDTATVEHAYSTSDVLSQVQLVERAIEHPRIAFEVRTPTEADLVEQLARPDSAVVMAINARVLAGRDGYAGHSVLVRRADEHTVIVEDPGPPPAPAQALQRDLLYRAWTSPTAGMANLIWIGRLNYQPSTTP